MCLFPSIPDTTTTQRTVTFPSVHWRASHFVELDVVRMLNIRKFFLLAYLDMIVVILICTSLSTIFVSILVQPTISVLSFCMYRSKSIACCSRCLKLHVSAKLT